MHNSKVIDESESEKEKEDILKYYGKIRKTYFLFYSYLVHEVYFLTGSFKFDR